MSVAASDLRGRKKATETQVEICSVRVGQGLYGVPITHILEIVGKARPQPVPLAPEFVGGMVHYRGDDGPQDILVLENSGGSIGLLVDSVGEVLMASSLQYEPNPSILDERRRALFGGAYKLKGSLLVMLNPENLDPMRLSGGAAA